MAGGFAAERPFGGYLIRVLQCVQSRLSALKGVMTPIIVVFFFLTESRGCLQLFFNRPLPSYFEPHYETRLAPKSGLTLVT